MAKLGEAWLGKEGGWQPSTFKALTPTLWQGVARPGSVRLGKAKRGMARLGKGNNPSKGNR